MTYTRSASLLLALIPSFHACEWGEAGNPIRVAFAAESATPNDTSVVFRFPTSAGPGVHLYTFPRLTEADWHFATPRLAVRRLVGFGVSEGQVYVETQDSSLVALDLESGLASTLESAVFSTAMGPTGVPHIVGFDGTLAAVIDRHTQPWDPVLAELPTRVWGTTRRRLLALVESDQGRRVDLFENSSFIGSLDLPAGLTAVTRWGDLAVVAVDSGLVSVRMDPSRDDTEFFPIPGVVAAMVFSAASHHLFVATADLQIRVINRFSLDGGEGAVLRQYPLADRIEAMRAGSQGRLLLLKPEGVDSVWIADATELTRVVTVPGSWDSDLPQVATDGTVLVRQGDDVVAIDPETAAEVGRIEDGAKDRWLVAAWNPRRPTLQLAEEVETGPDEAIDEADRRTYYAQLSSTSNQAWALARRDELRGAQLNAQVIYPDEYYDRYRVVLGPFDTSEEADNIGRRLGQPYWIITVQDTTATNR
ncbi:MAG: SPOR domain-containing protein [Gemmatimonadetes bacterium]|nr:SPOR domain-containing protein [Gemmatimonadota bacterium]